jgi:hypothetical protein
VSLIRMIMLGFSGALVLLIGLDRASPVSNFIQTRLGHRPSLITRVVFP